LKIFVVFEKSWGVEAVNKERSLERLIWSTGKTLAPDASAGEKEERCEGCEMRNSKHGGNYTGGL